MATMETDTLVEAYLRRLERAAERLQASRRAELVAEIREHIDAALGEEAATGETAVRNVLERLGPPEEIVEAAEPVEAATGGRKLEIAAVIALMIPFAGWIVGIALVLVSSVWSSRDKLIGIALALIPALTPLLLWTAGAESGAEQAVPVGDARPVGTREDDPNPNFGPVEVLGSFAIFLLGLPSALFLAWRLRAGGARR